MAHTPGPWEVAMPGEVDEHYAVMDGFGHTASVYGYPEEAATAWANASLIAAAPELLAALKLLRDPDGDGEWVCYCDDSHYEGGKCENCVATAAIDKAEGRSE